MKKNYLQKEEKRSNPYVPLRLKPPVKKVAFSRRLSKRKR